MNNRKKETLNQSIDRYSKNSHLLTARQELSKKWLNQRKMNSQRRASERAKMLRDAKMTPDENFGKGIMYFFKYDAKTKQKLDYFDEFPLILPFAFKNGLMFGLNLHYIPSRIRASILDFLTESRKGGLKVTPSQIVETLANHDMFKPAIHSYYPSHIVSNVQEIHASEWEDVIFLPLARFTSYTHSPHSQNKVYADYMAKI